MLKQTISYTDYNGEERTENFYFDLDEAEIIRLEATTEGGFVNMIRELQEDMDMRKFFVVFEDLLRWSYGKKTADGRRFVKNPEVFMEFKESRAYSEFVMMVMNQEIDMAEWILGILPARFRQKVVTAVQDKTLPGLEELPQSVREHPIFAEGQAGGSTS